MLLFQGAVLFAEPLKPGFYGAFAEGGEARAAAMRVFEAEQKADRVVRTDFARDFDLGLGKVEKGIRFPVRHKFDEIKEFLIEERHKNFVVVWFDKSIMWNEKDLVQQRLNEVVGQMKEVGYKRVVVLGAHSSGVHVLIDTGSDSNGKR